MTVKNEALLPLFAQLGELLEPYAARLVVRRDEPGSIDLWSEKEVVVDGRGRERGLGGALADGAILRLDPVEPAGPSDPADPTAAR